MADIIISGEGWDLPLNEKTVDKTRTL